MSSNTMNANNTRETPTITRKTRVIRSRNERSTLTPDDKVRYVYEVRAGAPLDFVWAFAAIHDDGYSYKAKIATDDRVIFSTKAPINEIRQAWNTQKKDLYVMIQTLNYVDDYTGYQYFTRYWDTKKDPDDYRIYYSDDSDSEDDE